MSHDWSFILQHALANSCLDINITPLEYSCILIGTRIKSWVNVAWFAILSRKQIYTVFCTLRRKLNVHDISLSINNFYILRLEFLYRPNVPWRRTLTFRLANRSFQPPPCRASVFRSDARQSLWPLTNFSPSSADDRQASSVEKTTSSHRQPNRPSSLLTPPPKAHCKSSSFL